MFHLTSGLHLCRRYWCGSAMLLHFWNSCTCIGQSFEIDVKYRVTHQLVPNLPLTSKWELRLVHKVSTCLALRHKSHLQINEICVLEYFCHPVQGVSLCGRTYVLYVLKSAKGTAHPDEPPCKHVQRTGNLILFQPSFPAFGQWTWPAWTSTCRRRRWGRESGPRRSAIPERTTGWTSR